MILLHVNSISSTTYINISKIKISQFYQGHLYGNQQPNLTKKYRSKEKKSGLISLILNIILLKFVLLLSTIAHCLCFRLLQLNTVRFDFHRFSFLYTYMFFYSNLYSESWVIYRGKTGGISRLIYDAFRETSNTKSPTEPKNKNKETFNNNTLIAIRPAKKIEKVQIL